MHNKYIAASNKDAVCKFNQSLFITGPIPLNKKFGSKTIGLNNLSTKTNK